MEYSEVYCAANVAKRPDFLFYKREKILGGKNCRRGGFYFFLKKKDQCFSNIVPKMGRIGVALGQTDDAGVFFFQKFQVRFPAGEQKFRQDDLVGAGRLQHLAVDQDAPVGREMLDAVEGQETAHAHVFGAADLDDLRQQVALHLDQAQFAAKWQNALHVEFGELAVQHVVHADRTGVHHRALGLGISAAVRLGHEARHRTVHEAHHRFPSVQRL